MTETNARDDSYVKALVFFCAFFALTLLPASASLLSLSPFDQGELIGAATFSSALPVFVVGVLSKSSGRTYSWLKFGALSIVLFLGLRLLTAASTLAPNKPVVIVDAEGKMPELIGQSLCQSAVPFQVSLPRSDFSPLPDLEQKNPNLRMWAWESRTTGERVIVQILKGSSTSPTDFREFIRGVQSSAQKNGDLQHEKIDTNSFPFLADFSYALRTGASYDQRCLSHGVSQDPSWIVCVATVSLHSQSLESVRDSLQLSPC